MAANDVRNTSGQEIGSGRSETELGVFGKYPSAQLTIAGQTLAFPVTRIQESGGNRIVQRERPMRDGAKLDDTGSKAKEWTLEAYFDNSIKEVDTINGQRSLYPDVLNDLIFLFDIHETCDLIVPTVGKQRVRCQSYSRTESFDSRDVAVATFVFVEDNEDSVDFRTITAPTANASARRLAQATTFDAQSIGAWDTSLENVDNAGSTLEDVSNGPGSVSQDVNQNAAVIDGNVVQADQTFKLDGQVGRDLFLDPVNSRAERGLTKLRDLAGQATNVSRRGRPKLIIIVFEGWTTMFKVSAVVQQDLMDLLDVNPDLDPQLIPPKTPIKVFATEALLNGSRASAA